MFQRVDETHNIGIVAVHNRANFHFNDAAPVGWVLPEHQVFGVEAGLAGQSAEIGRRPSNTRCRAAANSA